MLSGGLIIMPTSTVTMQKNQDVFQQNVLHGEHYAPSEEALFQANISPDLYDKMYEYSIKDPEGFWGEMAERLDWFSKPTKIKEGSFSGDATVKWYADGVLNACYNCIDRHLPERAAQTAIIFEGDDPSVDTKITYAQLKTEVCKLANALKEKGVEKGDRVVLYMPMIPQAAYAMLACARIGAIHSVVFAGFSPEALGGRINDCGAKVVITADEGLRGGKSVPLKANVDQAIALQKENTVKTVLMYRHTEGDVNMQEGRDVVWQNLVPQQSDDCQCEPMGAEDPLFILYTSGSTGKPKGALHTTGGYMVYTSLTHEAVLDYHEGDVYWCTADVGWITGHSYIVYGPLANGATTLMFEGVPTYPDASRFWNVVDKHQVNVFYTAPTVIRSLLAVGDDLVKSTDRSTLRLLGTVGEPINHEAWLWYHNVVGDGRCPIVDTWWQTETGGHMITPLPSTTLKPGAASTPFFGVEPAIMDSDGNEITGVGEGALVIKNSWPGQMRTVFGDHQRYFSTYFQTFPNTYFTGDGAKRDEDGYYWITGRMDDVLNVSGHRLGTAEIESAINEHPLVSESAIIGVPHEIKGQGIYAFVMLKDGEIPTDEMKKEVIKNVRIAIGPIATLDTIQWAAGLPKTRSGKIMRRVLRKIAHYDEESIGDTSTLADPTVVEALIEGRPDHAVVSKAA